jgi:hypothetical protein
MPTVVRIGAYRIVLHTGREHPPPHVHIHYQGRDVLVDLHTLECYGVQLFVLPDEVRRFLETNQVELLRRWQEYHER